MTSWRSASILAITIIFLAVAPQSLSAATLSCGPGAHWVDSCMGGYAYLSTETKASVTLDLDGDTVIDVSIPLVVFIGQTDVFAGSATVNTAPHSAFFQTEIFSLFETSVLPNGKTVTLSGGDGAANLVSDGPLYSYGEVDGEPSDPSLADHTGHVMFEVDSPANSFVGVLPGVPGNTDLVLHNTTPLVAECTGLTKAPPDTCKYFVIPSNLTLDLFDINGDLRGSMGPAYINGLPIAHHYVIPEPANVGLVFGGIGLLAFLRRRR